MMSSVTAADIDPTEDLGLAISLLPPSDTKTLEGGAVYRNGVHDISIANRDLTLKSDDPSRNAVIDLQGYSRAFWVESTGNLTLVNITITNGDAWTYNHPHMLNVMAGAIFNNGGTVTLDGCIFTENTASNGGVIFNSGTVTLTNCIFSKNFVNSHASYFGSVGGVGGVINNAGTLIASNSIFRENTAVLGSGVIINWGSGSANFVECIFAKNTVTSGDGAVATNFVTTAGSLNITNSVFYENHGNFVVACSDFATPYTYTVNLKDNFYFWFNPDFSDNILNPNSQVNLINAITNRFDAVDGYYYLNVPIDTVSFVNDTLTIELLHRVTKSLELNSKNSLPNLNDLILEYNSVLVVGYDYRNLKEIIINTEYNELEFLFMGDSVFYREFNVEKNATTLIADEITGVVGDIVQLTANLTSNGLPLQGYLVNFFVQSAVGTLFVGSNVTDANGIAIFNYKLKEGDTWYGVFFYDPDEICQSSYHGAVLTVTPFDYDGLLAEILLALALDGSRFTPASWTTLQAVLGFAQAMQNVKNAASQAEIDSYTSSLAAARLNLAVLLPPVVPLVTPIPLVNPVVKPNVDLKITKVVRKGNYYKITIKNLGKDKSGKTKLLIRCPCFKFAKVVDVKAIGGGKSITLTVKFFTYAQTKKHAKIFDVNYKKQTYETNYANNIYRLGKGKI